MLNKLQSIILLAIATIGGFKSTIAAQQTALAEKDATIRDLTAKLADEELDDDALRQAADDAIAARDAAESRTKELEAAIAAANESAERLAAEINEHPETPNVTPDFEVIPVPAPAEATEAAPGAEGATDPAEAPVPSESEAAPTVAGEDAAG